MDVLRSKALKSTNNSTLSSSTCINLESAKNLSNHLQIKIRKDRLFEISLQSISWKKSKLCSYFTVLKK